MRIWETLGFFVWEGVRGFSYGGRVSSGLPPEENLEQRTQTEINQRFLRAISLADAKQTPAKRVVSLKIHNAI